MSSLKEWKRDFNKRGKWNKFDTIIAVTSLAVGLIFGFAGTNFYINTQTNTVNNSTILGSACVGDCNNAYFPFTKVENKMIPYTHQFQILESKFGQEKWIERYNVKFILPNNNFAFLPKMKENDKYILAFSNEDCSDITVSENYQIPQNFNEEDVCFIKRLSCGDDKISSEIEQLKEESKYEEALQYIYYYPTDKALNNPDSCELLKQ